MSTTIEPTTAEELLMMPKDGFRYELVKGELKKMSPAGSEHGAVAMNVAILLGQYIKANKLGVVFAAETGFKLATDPDTGLRLMFLSCAANGFRSRGCLKLFIPARRIWPSKSFHLETQKKRSPKKLKVGSRRALAQFGSSTRSAAR